jgi:hypothetical protein
MRGKWHTKIERNTKRELERVELSIEEFSLPPCFVVCIVSKLD